MSRQALLVGNSVSYSDIAKSVTRPVLERTLKRVSELLSDLESPYSFDIRTAIDRPAKEVRSALEDAAERAARHGELLLFYYFGHGDLSSELQLLLLHPGKQKGETTTLPLDTIETRIRETNLRRSLLILDCCYAGAVARTFPFSLTGQHCRVASTVPSAYAYVTSGRLEEPIGTFTAAVMEAFTTPEACVSATDDRVTAESLFTYARDRTIELSGDNRQVPVIHGHLTETLFEFRSVPRIHEGYSAWADEKTAYAKILAICQTLRRHEPHSIHALHTRLLREHRRSFRTLFKKPDGSFEYRPVAVSVVSRYVRFLHRLGLLHFDTLALTSEGRALADRWKESYNGRLLAIIDTYLTRAGVSRDRIVKAAQRVLSNRRVPSKSEITDLLMLTGHRLPRHEIGIVLDLMGYIGAMRVTDERAYFPW